MTYGPPILQMGSHDVPKGHTAGEGLGQDLNSHLPHLRAHIPDAVIDCLLERRGPHGHVSKRCCGASSQASEIPKLGWRAWGETAKARVWGEAIATLRALVLGPSGCFSETFCLAGQ